MQKQELSTLSLALRAGKLILGFDKVIEEIKNKNAKGVFYAEDLSEKSCKELCFVAVSYTHLNLKDNTASLLELESGSNDPMSYMLTVVMVSLLGGQEISVGMLLLKQIAIGVLCGLVLGKVTVWLLNNLSIELEQGETILEMCIRDRSGPLSS